MELNKIYNEDCFNTMEKMPNKFVHCILTSPPYNTGGRIEYWSHKKVNGKRAYTKQKRYDEYVDNKTTKEYIDWSINLFDCYEKILKKNGCILYNLSYGNENPSVLWLLLAEIINNTDFIIADCIIWKKKTALPNSASKNKLTRICEFVFVIVRKADFMEFNSNKKLIKTTENGQKYYEVFHNIIEAKNNDGSNKLNKATFSTDLVRKLLNIYVTKNSIVYDSFMGTGTTALGCIEQNINFIGSELSKDQHDRRRKNGT
jgi:DNA modification methylase